MTHPQDLAAEYRHHLLSTPTSRDYDARIDLLRRIVAEDRRVGLSRFITAFDRVGRPLVCRRWNPLLAGAA